MNIVEGFFWHRKQMIAFQTKQETKINKKNHTYYLFAFSFLFLFLVEFEKICQEKFFLKTLKTICKPSSHMIQNIILLFSRYNC